MNKSIRTISLFRKKIQYWQEKSHSHKTAIILAYYLTITFV